MTSHVNINWGAVGDANRTEFNVNAKWSLKYAPTSSISRNVFSKLNAPNASISSERPPDVHRIQATTILSGEPIPTGTITMKRQSDGDCVRITDIKKVKQSLKRAEIDRTSRFVGTGSLQFETKRTSIESGSHMVENVSASSPALVDSNKKNATQQQRPDDLPKISPSPIPVTNVPVIDTSIGEFQCSNISQGASHFARSHCHRKHKKGCPKHVKNEIIRRELSMSQGAAPDFSPVLENDGSTLNQKPGQPPITRLEDLPVPVSVGKILATVLTGIYNPHASGQMKHRVDHPDYIEHSSKLRTEVQESRGKHVATVKDSKTVGHYHPEDYVRDKLDQTYFRQKYELKDHMQKMAQMGKGLLRDIKGGAMKV